MQQVLVLNGSRTPEGDTKIAAAAARAFSSVARVRVLTVPGPAVDRFRLEGVELEVAPAPNKAACLAWMTARALAVSRDPSVVLYTADRTFAADVALHTALLLRRRCIFHVNMPFVVRRNWRYALAQRIAEVWHVSEFTRDESARRGLRVGRVIPNCLTDPVPTLGPREAEEASGIARHPSAVLVGRLSPFKGQETFIRAFRVLKDRGVELYGYLVGYDTGEGKLDSPPRPDYEAYLRGLIAELDVADRVQMLGRRPGVACFVAADIACALSDDEPFGLVLGEAALAGCPVVATRTGAFRELVRDGETAWMVERRDAVQAADALAALATDPARREALATGARGTLAPLLSFERFRDDVVRALGEGTARGSRWRASQSSDSVGSE